MATLLLTRVLPHAARQLAPLRRATAVAVPLLRPAAVPLAATTPMRATGTVAGTGGSGGGDGSPAESTGDKWLRRLGWLGGFYREKQVLPQKQLVTFMWEDVENRIRLLRVRACVRRRRHAALANPRSFVCSQISDRTVVQETTKELLSQFYGLLFAYDEGLVADDVVLASALWRCGRCL